ncbi:MAG: adenosylcobinamide-GDP ribazoletransferase [Rhodococcus sp. (in: high G+C Gram-positive bacteria)]
MLDTLRLTFSWLTVFPVRGPQSVDRDDGRRAITAAPVVGIVLGGIVAALVWLGVQGGLPAALAGMLGVGAHALLTRGMHLDGLADTADGLGCFGSPERAREVMKSGSAGPFGVCALVLGLGAQAVAAGELVSRGQVFAVLVAAFAARCAVVAACRRGVPAATDTGFGVLVAGTQSTVAIGFWTIAACSAGVLAVPGRWFQGVAAVAVALTVGTLFARHCVRRFGGLVGDVLGSTLELTAATVLVLCLIAP